jgi:uncharacterized protein YndB with AHSA1/START domain
MTDLFIDIDAPIDDVWSYIADIESHVDWMDDAESIVRLNDKDNESGAKYLCATRVGPLTTNDVMEVTAYEAPHLMRIQHIGSVSGSGEFRLEEIDERTTRFTWHEELVFPWYMGGPVGKIVGMKLLHHVWRGNLETLKKEVETKKGA